MIELIDAFLIQFDDVLNKYIDLFLTLFWVLIAVCLYLYCEHKYGSKIKVKKEQLGRKKAFLFYTILPVSFAIAIVTIYCLGMRFVLWWLFERV